VLISAEGVGACLAAWEQPGEAEVPDARRRFEVLWSFEPAVVADAMAVAADLLSPIDPDVAARVHSARDAAVADLDPAPALRYGAAVTHRMIGYLGRLLVDPGDAGPHVQL
jgi:DICT domain-containing protein